MDEYADGPKAATIHADRAVDLVRGEEAVPERVPQVMESCNMLADASDRLQATIDRLEARLAPVLNPNELVGGRVGDVEKDIDRASLAQRLRNNAEFIGGQANRLESLLNRVEV